MKSRPLFKLIIDLQIIDLNKLTRGVANKQAFA